MRGREAAKGSLGFDLRGRSQIFGEVLILALWMLSYGEWGQGRSSPPQPLSLWRYPWVSVPAGIRQIWIGFVSIAGVGCDIWIAERVKKVSRTGNYVEIVSLPPHLALGPFSASNRRERTYQLGLVMRSCINCWSFLVQRFSDMNVVP